MICDTMAGDAMLEAPWCHTVSHAPQSPYPRPNLKVIVPPHSYMCICEFVSPDSDVLKEHIETSRGMYKGTLLADTQPQ